mmetsp:Transcript_26452/g.67619  ORF Transcript_26452/g.67619 Transcript_26452/m.67619 type:complete len:123 (-) Transcript_26452:246-614(-)
MCPQYLWIDRYNLFLSHLFVPRLLSLLHSLSFFLHRFWCKQHRFVILAECRKLKDLLSVSESAAHPTRPRELGDRSSGGREGRREGRRWQEKLTSGHLTITSQSCDDREGRESEDDWYVTDR